MPNERGYVSGEVLTCFE